MIIPQNFPYWWCSDYGEDEYGIFMGFKFKSVRQGFRWIQPGTFIMGSPKTEVGGWGREAQHQIKITEGYWLAETTCTQALWQVVMKDNPSRFKGMDRPVEEVSWQDVWEFLGMLNTWQPGLDLRLPSEAEWEYACRAGTTTPFHFGMTITTDQVNFDGTRPPVGSPIGEYRKETVPVKALPANDWGLFQMHGNVGEWCADIYKNFSAEDSSSSGQKREEARVLRGGSWDFDGRNCRSASRDRRHPGLHNHFTGFRMARSL